MRNVLMASVCTVLGTSAQHVAYAEMAQEANYLETARSYCAAEVEGLMQNSEPTAKRLSDGKIEWDPEIPENQHRAFNKMGALAIVMADQVTHLTIYMNTISEGHSDAERLANANWSLLELAHCLWLSREDRDLIDEMVLSTPMDESGQGPTYSSSDFAFGPLDQAECFRWREASRRVLEIPQQSEGAETRMYEILQETVGQCDQNFGFQFEEKS